MHAGISKIRGSGCVTITRILQKHPSTVSESLIAELIPVILIGPRPPPRGLALTLGTHVSYFHSVSNSPGQAILLPSASRQYKILG